MKSISLTKGLDVPIAGSPELTVTSSKTVRHVALIGDDYPGMKPTMLVKVGDKVRAGQPLFEDKKSPGVFFTAPGSGEIAAINRGKKRKFESIIIELNNEDPLNFCNPESNPAELGAGVLRDIIIKSGLWTSFRTRPYGKVPSIDTNPASLFITAMDTTPLAPDLEGIIDLGRNDFLIGINALQSFVETANIFICTAPEQQALTEEPPGTKLVSFGGPHPAGLPSTHIHFLDPVNESKTVWHIEAQDVIGIGFLLRTGRIPMEKIIALSGSGVTNPRHIRTRIGASLRELCVDETTGEDLRVLSGSVLDGREACDMLAYLGRYHQQLCCIPEGTGRQFFGWLRPGSDRFSVTRAFLSSFLKPSNMVLDTAVWGGDRAIFPLGTYEKVMPLDVEPIYLLKSLASGNTEKAKALGCLELVEEDLALCSYVCPGKNDFGRLLRQTLTSIETDG